MNYATKIGYQCVGLWIVIVIPELITLISYLSSLSPFSSLSSFGFLLSEHTVFSLLFLFASNVGMSYCNMCCCAGGVGGQEQCSIMQRLHNQTKKCLIHIPFDQKHSIEKKREVILDIS